MTLAGRIGRAIFWGQAGRLMEAALLFSFSLLLARTLGPAAYGLYALGISLAGVCGFISLLGLGPETLGRFLPEIASNGGAQRTRQLMRTLLAVRSAAITFVACLAFAFRGAISARLHLPAVVAALGAVLLVFAMRSIFDLLTYFSAGLLELRRVALAKLISAATAPGLFALLLSFRRSGVNTAWMSLAAGSLAGTCILLFPLLATHTAEPSVPEPLPIRRILTFGLFTWATNFFVYILGDSTDVLLLGWLTPDRAAIGRYAIGARVVFSLTSLLLGWAALVSVASFSEAFQRSGIRGTARAVESQWKLAILCTVGPASLLLRYAREILTTFFSSAYAQSVPVTRVLCTLVTCSVLLGFSLGTSALYAVGKERLACYLVAAAAAFNIVAEIVLVHRIGPLGAAYATGLSFILLAVISTAASRIYIPLRFPATFAGKIIAASGIALLPTFCLTSDSIPAVATGALAWGVVFTLGLLVLKPLEDVEFEAVSRMSPRVAAVARVFSARRLGMATGGIPWQE